MIWDLAGLDQITYSHLPWPEQRKLIIRHGHIPIRNAWKCPCYCHPKGLRQAYLRWLHLNRLEWNKWSGEHQEKKQIT